MPEFGSLHDPCGIAELYCEGQQPKHLGDIRGLMKFETLDLPYVEANVERLGLREQ